MMTPDPAQTQTEDNGSATGGTGANAPGAAKARTSVPRTIGVVALATVAGAVAGALALYGMNGLPGNEAPPPSTKAASGSAAVAPAGGPDADCAPAVARASALAPLVTGEIAALKLATEPRRMPPLTFTDASGKAMTLKDFSGRTLLVNLWATWCVPCRKEMPALNALQGKLGGPGFEVVAINLDTRDPEKPKTFLAELGANNLRYFADPETKSFQALRAVGRGFGLPTTLLVDEKGCEMAFLAGPAEWSGPDAQALLRAAMAGAADPAAGAASR